MTIIKRALLCLSALCIMVTPFTIFAGAVEIDDNIYNMPVDSRYPYVVRYMYGANSGIVDFKTASGTWYRYILNNNYFYINLSKATVNYTTHYYIEAREIGSSSSSGSYYLGYSKNCGAAIQNINNYSSYDVTRGLSRTDLGTTCLVNICGLIFDSTELTQNDVARCDFNAYYPFAPSGSGGSDSRIDQVLANQRSILDQQNAAATEAQSRYKSQESAAQSRYKAQESAAQSRNDNIMNAGDDVTVSTIDNWVGGDEGLAGKLNKYASTLSENLSIFSSNARENQSGLNAAGSFLRSFNDVFPTGIIAAILCFMIILIAVKVIGR